MVTSHSQALTGLLPNQVVEYRAKSADAAGNTVTSGIQQFTTLPDTTPPVISNIQATSITANGATISWTTNEPSTTQVEYGPTTSYGSSTTLDSTLVTSHSQPLTGLTSGTTYHFRVKSADASSNLAVSGDNTFNTPIVTYTISGRITFGAAGVGGVTILVNGGATNPNTVTNSNGDYTTPGLPEGGPYLVSPSHTSWIFSPGGTQVSPLNSNVSGINFSAFPIPSGVWVSPNNGSWTAYQFYFWTQGLYNPYPYRVEMLYSTSSSTAVNQCYLNYYPGSNQIILSMNDGTGWVQPFITYLPGSSSQHGYGLAHNNQCLLDFYNAYAQYQSGTQTLVWNVPLHFFRAFGGGKQLYVRMNDGAYPWNQIGSWAVPTPATADPVLTISTPAAGATVSGVVNITGTVSDANTAISKVAVYIDGNLAGNATVNGSNYSYSWNAGSGGGAQRVIKVVAVDSDSPTNLITVLERTVTVN